MPSTSISYSKLSMVARGFADSLIHRVSSDPRLPTGMPLSTRDFTEYALLTMAVECAAFLDAVETFHPRGKAGVRRTIAAHDLGWHFFLKRQRTGIGFENFSLGEFGEGLDSLALRFPVIRVQISDGEIDFL